MPTPSRAPNDPPIAAFDFDGTISLRDSLQDFARFSLGTPGVALAYLKTAPAALHWMTRERSRQTLKAAFLRACWNGTRREQLESQALSYATTTLPHLVRPEMLARVQEHRQLGHRLVLVSASPSIYLKPWALSAGFDAVLATELAFANDRFLGRLATPNCRGPEKVVRLASWLGTPDVMLDYAYGDSEGDHDMLARARFPWLRGRDTALPSLEGFHQHPA